MPPLMLFFAILLVVRGNSDVPTLFGADAPSLPVLKTGTTIVGVCCRDGVVLGADTRSTGGPLVMDKNKLKIHTVAPFIFCCAAGTSADCDQVTRRAGHHLALLRIERLQCGEETAFDPLPAALNSITASLEAATPAKRMPSSVMILGGIDDDGPSLYMVDDSKVAQRLSFAALGSGSVDAIAVLEAARRRWQRAQPKPAPGPTDERVHSADAVEDIDIDTAIEATRQAVRAGILNDLGSGSHVDICVIQRHGVRRWRERMRGWDDDRAKHGGAAEDAVPQSQPVQGAPPRQSSLSGSGPSHRLGKQLPAVIGPAIDVQQ
jgi:20S proteasome subunit beta 2